MTMKQKLYDAVDVLLKAKSPSDVDKALENIIELGNKVSDRKLKKYLKDTQLHEEYKPFPMKKVYIG